MARSSDPFELFRMCKMCEITKSIDDFYRHSGRNHKRYICKDCNKLQLQQYKRSTPEAFERHRYVTRMRAFKHSLIIKALKDKPCLDCGVQYPPYVMDFDHIDNKLFGIGGGSGKNFDKLLEEILKCELVCANCHRERTFKRKLERTAFEDMDFSVIVDTTTSVNS